MRNLKILTLMLFIGLFIGGNGCRKDELLLKSSNNLGSPKLDKTYRPVFNTLSHYSNNLNASSHIQILAPTFSQLDKVGKDLGNVKWGTPPSKKIAEIYRMGQRPEINYSIIYDDKNDDKYIIAVPMTKDSIIESILFYFGGLEQAHFLLVEKGEIENYVLMHPQPDYNRDKNDLLYISTFNILRQSFNKSKDQTIIKWLDDFQKLRPHPIGGTRCTVFIIETSYAYFEEGPYGQTAVYVLQIEYQLVNCGGDGGNSGGDGGGTGTFGSTGGGSDGPTNPTPDPDEKDMPPMMNRDCWKNLSPQSRHDLNNTIDIVLSSSCDEEAAQSEIESILNEECSKLNSNGDLSGDEQGGVVSIEQGMANSEFGDNFNKALEGVDYIDNNIADPRLRCLWEKLMKTNNNVICDQISYFDGPTKLNFSVWSQEFIGPNQQNAVVDRDQNGQIAMQLNINNLKDKCDIEIIKTMIHESVHAGILNVVLGTHEAGWGINDVPDLKYYYDNYTNFHHEYMAGSYFDKLVSALKQYFGNEYTDLEYEALMWSGLHKTSAYKKLSESKRKSIEAIWDKFKNRTTCKKTCK